MKIKTKSTILTHNPVVHGGLNSIENRVPGILDFSSNVNPAGMPSQIKNSIKNHLYRIEFYPDLHSSELSLSLKKYTKLSESNLVVGNGAIELIYNFCNAFLSPKIPVLITIPTFGEYEIAAKLCDCKISYFKTMDLNANIDLFILQIPKNGCIFLCNPNNPTGKLLPKKQLLKIIKIAKKLSCIVFVDECFIELVPDSNQSVISFVKTYENLFVLRSLTKSFGIPGIRIGYGASSKNIISILKKIKLPWSVNTLAQTAGNIAIKNKSYLTKSNLIIKQEYDFLVNRIEKIQGFKCHKSSTNFILIKTKHDSTILQKKLLKNKILIRNCKNFRGLNNHYIRIAIKSHKDNLKLIKALEKLE